MSKIKNALKKIAKREGISIEEVYHEMQIAIDMGYLNPNSAIQAAWKNIYLPCGKPRPEDVIAHCVKQIKI